MNCELERVKEQITKAAALHLHAMDRGLPLASSADYDRAGAEGLKRMEVEPWFRRQVRFLMTDILARLKAG
ncbi:MAG TPA: hypothetical protein VG167_19015 [Verrucomicrobiae bacterium]|nr:hypothetical protein [Verrucomicrobiae bacterium]